MLRVRHHGLRCFSTSHVPRGFRVSAKIGVLSFGGPAGQIALMHRMLVEARRWIAEDLFLHALNFRMLLPGLFAVPFPLIVLTAVLIGFFAPPCRTAARTDGAGPAFSAAVAHA